MGLEPTTPGTTIRCSNQLSYTHHKNGTPEGTRTPGLLLRRQLLSPAELLGQINRATYLHYKVANYQNLRTFLDNLPEYLVRFDLQQEQFEMLHCDLQIYFY